MLNDFSISKEMVKKFLKLYRLLKILSKNQFILYGKKTTLKSQYLKMSEQVSLLKYPKTLPSKGINIEKFMAGFRQTNIHLMASLENCMDVKSLNGYVFGVLNK